jgi:hypothetical protein
MIREQDLVIDLTTHWTGLACLAIFFVAYGLVIAEEAEMRKSKPVLTRGGVGSILSIGPAAGVALMGQAREAHTFTSHLKWSWAVAVGYVASIAVHRVINASLF